MESGSDSPKPHGPRLHPHALRIMHWTNALAMIIMIGSGWKIYNDEVLFGWLHFPDEITIGGEAQGALQWHFLGMWILTFNGLAYVTYGLVTGRFRRMLLPIYPREVIATAWAAMRFRLKHDNHTNYNAVQRVLYVGIILICTVQVVSGLFIWKPMQFSELMPLFGDFQGGRLVHFLCMAAICAFLVVHVSLALLVPRTIIAMLAGGPIVEPMRPQAPSHTLEPASRPAHAAEGAE